MAVMGVHAALLIQNLDNDIRCGFGNRSETTNKWPGTVNLYRGGSFHRTVFASEAVYGSPEEAITCMKELVERIRAKNT